MSMREKYLWITDPHIKPWGRRQFLNTILNEKPKAIFLTGDISNSYQTLMGDLDFLGMRVGRPVYFVTGNHDYHGSDFETVHSGIRRLCNEHSNLVWIDEELPIALTEEVGIVGNRGWYDAFCGNTEFLKFTIDWWLIKDFRNLPNFNARIEMFRELAKKSAEEVCEKLLVALEQFKSVYLLTHFPTHKEANRCHSLLSEAFYEPYNTNIVLGKKLEEIMAKYKKRHLTVLSGHTHEAAIIHAARNIEVRVGKGSYFKLTEDEIIYI